MIAEEEAKKKALEADALGFWERVSALDPEGQKVALRAAQQFKPDLYQALEEAGVMSGEGLVKAKEQKKVSHVSQRNVGGFTYQDILYEDGSTESKMVGAASEVPVEGPSVSEQLDVAKFEREVTGEPQEREDKIMKDAMAMTQTQFEYEPEGGRSYNEILDENIEYLKSKVTTPEQANMSPEQREFFDDLAVKREMYSDNSDAVKILQESYGLQPTGVWDDMLEYAMARYALGGTQ